MFRCGGRVCAVVFLVVECRAQSASKGAGAQCTAGSGGRRALIYTAFSAILWTTSLQKVARQKTLLAYVKTLANKPWNDCGPARNAK